MHKSIHPLEWFINNQERLMMVRVRYLHTYLRIIKGCVISFGTLRRHWHKLSFTSLFMRDEHFLHFRFVIFNYFFLFWVICARLLHFEGMKAKINKFLNHGMIIWPHYLAIVLFFLSFFNPFSKSTCEETKINIL